MLDIAGDIPQQHRTEYLVFVDKITVEDGVTSLYYKNMNSDTSPFRDMTNLTDVNLSESVRIIGRYVFNNLGKLKNIKMPSNLTGIGESAFKKCYALKSIEIPAGVTVINTDTFSGCTGLESIILHDSLKQIRYGAFSSCTSLKSVQLPKYLEKPDESAYDGSGLTSVTVPGSLTQIGEKAFQNCTGLTTVELEEGVIGIGGPAFSGCSALSSVSLPNNLKDIEQYAFNICSSIQSVKLPENLEKIGECAFNQCESLKDITIPESVTEIGSKAFELCRDLKSFTVLNPEVILPEDTGKNAKTPFISNCTYNEKNIFEGTLYGYKGSTLETYAKNHELNFEEIQTVPTSCELSETLSWKYNPARHELVITGEGDMPDFEKMEDVPWYTYRDDIFFISLPNGLTAIGDYAFWGCRNHHIDLPAGLTRIGKYSFASNSNLENIELPSSLKTLGDSALSVCMKLKTIDIPENLNEISEGAFMLSGLETITLPEYVTSIGKLSFALCPYLTDVFILNPECTIDMEMSTISSQLFASGDPKNQFSGTIYGYVDSTAEAYAETNNCNFLTVKFGVHFDANGGTGKAPDDSICTILEFPQNTLNVPHGMEFMGWRVNDKVYQPGETLRLTTISQSMRNGDTVSAS